MGKDLKDWETKQSRGRRLNRPKERIYYMKVKNVIKGLLRKYTLEEINILTPERVVFSGDYLKWKETSVDMILYKKAVENCEVINHMMFNNRKAFLFIPELDVYYPPKD